MNDEYGEIMEFLSKLNCKFKVVEDKINPKIQAEYFKYSNSFSRDELSADEAQKLTDCLYNLSIAESEKKKALTLLSHLGTVVAYRQIEKYHNDCQSEELKQWSALALQECGMFLENSLLDENISLITSGLGGLQDKLRFYYLILPLPDKLFTVAQQDIIEKELDFAATEFNCIVETVDLSDEYVGLTALIPMTVAIAKFVNTAIEKCNELGGFVLEGYFATNQEIPDENKIKHIIGKIRKNEELSKDDLDI
ncbi:MAG: hypothetical protein LBT50_03130 [Prevotellaceae bacterium]|nr:hypothetical protein [Prevotellaceae bacterium]